MVPSTLKQVSEEILRLRRERGHRTHLPGHLRQSIVDLAAEHSVEVVIRELGVTRKTIERWVERQPVPARAKREKKALAPARNDPIAFFEIKTGLTPPTRTSECASAAIELARPDGMTLRLSGELARELAASMLDRFTTTGGMR